MGVAFGGIQQRKGCVGVGQDLPAAVQCLDHVGERGDFGVADDRIDLGVVLSNTLFDSGFKVFGFDPGERRNSKGGLPGFEQRIGSLGSVFASGKNDHGRSD